jgi:outer membrane protein TolC
MMGWLVAVLAAGVVADAAPAEAPVALTLEQLAARARAHGPELAPASGQIEAAEADLMRARLARYVPELKLRVLAGPSPRVECAGYADPAARPTIGFCVPVSGELADLGASGGLGIFGRLELDLVQPLYTWGRLDGAVAAAEGGVAARTAERAVKEGVLALRVTELFWGLQLAREGLEVIQEVDEKLVKAEKTVEERLAAGTGDLTQVDLIKVRLERAKLAKLRTEATQKQRQAEDAMRFTVGLGEAEPLAIEPRDLKGRPDAPPGVETFLAGAEQARPEARAMEGAIDALQGKVDAETGRWFPQLFLAGKLRYAESSNRDDPRSPFISDPFDTFSTGVLVGIEQDLAFHRVWADVGKARADLARVEHERAMLARALPLEIRRRYEDLRAAAERWEVSRGAVRSARSWMTSVGRSFDLGVTGARDLLEGYGAYSEARAEALSAAHDYFVALARLKAAAGRDPAGPIAQ